MDLMQKIRSFVATWELVENNGRSFDEVGLIFAFKASTSLFA